MSAPLHRSPGHSRGATLIELMVGLVLGLVVTMVVAQVMSFAETQKRITTGGGDAQVNGALALYTLQREIQMAGYGLTSDQDSLGCPVKAQVGNAGAAYNWTIAPITIVDGANGAPDQISVLSASRAFSIPLVLTADHAKTGDRFVVRSPLGAAAGDMMIAVPAGYDAATNWCTAFSVSSIAGSNQLVHAVGAASPWSQDTGSSIMPAAGYPTGTLLVNAGQLVNRTYTVTATQDLRQSTLNTSTGALDNQDLFPQIVNLQAMYGKDTTVPADGVVDTYDNVTPTTNAGWRQVLTVRLAVVARSATYNKDEVTQAAPQWDVGAAVTVSGATTCPNSASKCIALKVDTLTDWKHYRYTVFDVVVPLRNMMWGG
jgi:type IV pilus assembly protein PilW